MSDGECQESLKLLSTTRHIRVEDALGHTVTDAFVTSGDITSHSQKFTKCGTVQCAEVLLYLDARL